MTRDELRSATAKKFLSRVDVNFMQGVDAAIRVVLEAALDILDEEFVNATNAVVAGQRAGKRIIALMPEGK